jgi:hypothetical protein
MPEDPNGFGTQTVHLHELNLGFFSVKTRLESSLLPGCWKKAVSVDIAVNRWDFFDYQRTSHSVERQGFSLACSFMKVSISERVNT